MIDDQMRYYGVDPMIGNQRLPRGSHGRTSGKPLFLLISSPLLTTGFEICADKYSRFLWDKERELWDTFQDLDKNGDGRLDAVEMRAALSRSGVDITPATVEDLVRHLAHGSSPESLPQKATLSQEDMYITFGEFRDFLIMLPRRATPFEIYKCKSISCPNSGLIFGRIGAKYRADYQVKTRYSDGRGAARVDKEGDINVSFPRAPGSTSTSTALFGSKAAKEKDQEDVDADDFGDIVDDSSTGVDHHEAWRFLLAGGVAGAGMFSHPISVCSKVRMGD